MRATSKFKNRSQLPLWIVSHPANRHAPLRALARAVKFQVESRIARAPVIVPFGDARIYARPGHSASSAVVYGCPPDYAEMMAWRRLLRPRDLFVDIGANEGTYTLWAAQRGAKVIAVEPDPANLIRLGENIALNEMDVDVVAAAASSAAGHVSFHIRAGTIGNTSAKAVTLDGLLAGRKCRGVKIDVEGSELDVLRGASDSLRHRRVDILQLEWNALADRHPVRHLLVDAGYLLHRPDHTGTLRRCPSPEMGADVFAVRSGI